MGWQEINIRKYIEQLKINLNLKNHEDILEKDLLLTLILAEFEKKGLGAELIFKGGTLLSRNYLKYHRFSEDLDFVYKYSGSLRELTRSARERKVKAFLDSFVPKLKEIAEVLGLDFSIDRSNKRYCKMLSGRTVYTFKVYYTDNKYIKVEINFIEKLNSSPEKVSVKAITDLFDSKELLFTLGLDIKSFNVMSYSLKEITLEKYRATLTRKKLQERDLFDLFLIKDSLKADVNEIVEKIKNSSLIKKDLIGLINEKLDLLQKGKFFESDEKIEQLAIQLYKESEFEEFKEKVKPLLIEICKKFLAK
ncbi:MAG TPA: nucleotidyl transferase AbiEii/AbiGii toxin family protein [Candidatus Nanoarchaeia archaeon]|nr:nucleotidyl transferase AbiEii/AbiGii toxin family protein [Candidatus Nanoarchaeia archaeon]